MEPGRQPVGGKDHWRPARQRRRERLYEVAVKDNEECG